jgi:hypothetical protein
MRIEHEAPPTDSGSKESKTIHARAYQLEMFEASLKENIIVVVSNIARFDMAIAD